MKRRTKTLRLEPNASILHLSTKILFLDLVNAKSGSTLIEVTSNGSKMKITWEEP